MIQNSEDQTIERNVTKTESSTIMSPVEANRIKAETFLINQTVYMQWIKLAISCLLGVSVIMIGLFKLTDEPTNYNFVALILIGFFIFSASRPLNYEEIINSIKSLKP